MRRGGHQEKADRNVEIIRLCQEGLLTYQNIGDRFGITRERVRQIAQRHGLPRRNRAKKPITQEARVEIIQLGRNGLHISGIEDVTGYGYYRIKAILDEAGVVPYNGQDIFGDDARSEAVKLVEAGYTYFEAAEKIGITRNAVAGACNRAGIKVPEKEKADRHARGCDRGAATRRETLLARPESDRKALAQRMHSAKRAKAELEDA